ncbi:hypothetical protein BA062_15165 [Prauserella flavalba]|uniref:Uncharacterized protein n=1 Tax=Prauserella flavalba TaxID=1477506 RepID=A0A318LXL9_9PSEU|nr:hypothetical protein BA062_15165 [Prauserella flavalba]
MVTGCEFVGFGPPVLAGALTADSASTVALPLLLAAGAIEGTLLGLGQATVLRRALLALSRARWTVATALAAVVAYVLALGPFTWAEDAPIPVLVLLGSGVLASIGTAQWLVLRGHVPRAGRWIGVTALAWLAGLAVFLAVATPLWQPGQPTALIVAIGLGSGLLMAAAMSAVTGFGLRLLRSR